MDIAQIKEIGAIIQQLGGTGKEAFYAYLGINFLKDILFATVIITFFTFVYKLLKPSLNWNMSQNIIMDAANINHYISTSEARQIAKLITKARELEQDEREKERSKC